MFLRTVYWKVLSRTQNGYSMPSPQPYHPAAQVGMGTENRFFFRTGAQWIDSLEPLAYLLNDSAYRFRSLQMCHDITHALRCFGYAANMSSRQKRSKVWLYFTRKDTNAVICNSCKSLMSAKGGTTSNMQKHLAHTSTQFICRTVACLIHYYLATQQQQVSQAAAELTRRHLLLMPKVTCLFS